MALIKCPECSKDISDRVKSCPHCGYPIAEEYTSNDKPQKVELISINLKNKKNKQIISFSLIIILIISAFGIFKFLSNKTDRTSYIENLNVITTKMLMSGSKAEHLANLAAKVWRNTIFKDVDYETIHYTHSDGRIHSDFNISIMKLYNDEEIIESIQSLENDQLEISEIMKQLKNPKQEFEKCYGTVSEMYGSFQGLVDLAISPKGSLQSYSNSISEKADKFMDSYNRIKTQIPEN